LPIVLFQQNIIMDLKRTLCISMFLCCACSIICVAASCPPEGYDSVSPFSLDAYITDNSTAWYVQQQQPISYQPEDSLFCVRARYTRLDNGRIGVDNFARIGSVTGRPQNPNGFQLNAIVPDEEVPSKLAVGVPFIPPASYGPYWVVAAGPYSPDDEEWTGNYEWAIITGGLPGFETGNGCIGTGRFQNEGFWLFTREQVASQETIDELRAIAESLGLDTSVLVPVQQEGCSYGTDPSQQCRIRGARCFRSGQCCSGVCSRGRGFFAPRRCAPISV
jgi:apolipoprotein D and lipocalin family protein